MDKPEALRLADELEEAAGEYWRFQKSTGYGAAAELRRLHASCEDYAQHKQRQDQRIQTLYAQRDALLEALKEVLAWGTDQNYVRAEAACDKARAVIKAVEDTE